jgi:hypothetical protein
MPKNFLKAKQDLDKAITYYTALFKEKSGCKVSIISPERYQQIGKLISLLKEKNPSSFRLGVKEVHDGINTFWSSRLKTKLADILSTYTAEKVLVTQGAVGLEVEALSAQYKAVKKHAKNLEQRFNRANSRIEFLENEKRMADGRIAVLEGERDAANAEKDKALNQLKVAESLIELLKEGKGESQESKRTDAGGLLQAQIVSLNKQVAKEEAQLEARTAKLMNVNLEKIDIAAELDKVRSQVADLSVLNLRISREKADITKAFDAVNAENQLWRKKYSYSEPIASLSVADSEDPILLPEIKLSTISISQAPTEKIFLSNKDSKRTHSANTALPANTAALIRSAGGSPTAMPTAKAKKQTSDAFCSRVRS